MDKLKAMQTFVQIAEHGGLSAAARSSGASLPAVVRSLAAYEASLGVRLLNRTTRRVSLTEEGRTHLQHCREVLGLIAEAEAHLRQGVSEPAGLLTVTAPVFFGQLHLAPAVARFVRHYPQMQCRVVLLDRVVNLLEEGFDLGVRIGLLEDSSLVARPIASVRRVVVASPVYLSERGMPVHPRDLLKQQCVRRMDRNPLWGPFYEGGRSFELRVSGALEFNHNAPAVAACVAGAGFGEFFSYQVARHLRSGELIEVLQAFQGPPHPLQLVYPHARLLPQRARLFIDCMHSEFQGLGHS